MAGRGAGVEGPVVQALVTRKKERARTIREGPDI
jgi:hypothetical protein